jgi:hypothetical protein
MNSELLEQVRSFGILLQGKLEVEEDINLIVQRNPKFPEGSMPSEGETERRAIINAFIKGALGLDPDDKRSFFKVGMDGWGQHGGGLIILNADANYAAVLALKGDPYHNGQVGTIGGQGADVDKGDDLAATLREKGQEVGKFPFDPARLIELCKTDEWRTRDSRGEYWVKCTFYVYIARQDEVDQLMAGYNRHVTETGGDPEIKGLKQIPLVDLATFMVEKRTGYVDQCEAFVMLLLCMKNLGKARNMLEMANVTYNDQILWKQAGILAYTPFKGIVTDRSGDWLGKLDTAALF